MEYYDNGNRPKRENSWEKLSQCLCRYHFLSLSIVMLIFVLATIVSSYTIINREYNTEPYREWILVGGVTSTSASFRVRTGFGDNGKEFVVSINEDLDPSSSVFRELIELSLEGEQEEEYVRRVDVDGLEPSTQYYYGVIQTTSTESTTPASGETSTPTTDPILKVSIERKGSFRTPFPENTRFNFRFATSGCAWTGSKHSIFRSIASLDPPPLMFLHLGDFHYEDLDTPRMSERMDAIDKVMGSGSQRELFGKVALSYMWDDHDWLGYNAGRGEGEGRDVALRSYSLAFPHYFPLPAAADAEDEREEEVVSPYQAFTIGTVRFLLLDLRSEATESQIYSDAQRNWLYDELSKSQDYDFVMLISTKPWIGPVLGSNLADGWNGYANDRSGLSELITEIMVNDDADDTSPSSKKKKNLIMLASDAHMVAFDDGSNTFYGNTSAPSTASFPILHSGPMDRQGSAKGGPFTDGCHTTKFERVHQYSVVDFTFDPAEDGTVEPCMILNSYRSDGSTIVSKNLCGTDIFSDKAGRKGSCSEPFFSTRSNGLGGAALATLGVTGVFASCAFGKIRGFVIGSVIFFFLALTVLLGFGIPLSRGIPQIETETVFLIALLQMVVGFWYVFFWVCVHYRGVGRKRKKEEKTEIDGEDGVMVNGLTTPKGTFRE